MSADASDARVLNPAVLDELRESLGEEAPEIISVAASRFATRSASRLQAAQEAAARGDAAVLAQLAHQLRGGASQLGAERMTSLAAELEQMARQGVVDGAAALVGRLQDAFVETQAALRELGVAVVPIAPVVHGDTGT
jgi:HPt (histidine-containing phosphotransfer) domain-containing protein